MKTVLGLVLGLRRHDLRAARTFMNTLIPGVSFPIRLARFLIWVLHQSFVAIPRALKSTRFARPVSRTPIWLAAGNPLANHPWDDNPAAALPERVDLVVIGAGFTGAGCAYHWAKAGQGHMAILEMDDPACGASGRNEGLVVMGRYFAMVRDTVRPYLDQVRADLSPADRARLAEQFASRYAQSAYKNADLIEETVRSEGYECEYARNGWIQARDQADQAGLEASIQAGTAAGFDDWASLPPEAVREKGGMRVEDPAGFSRRAASFHPAKWVWSLLRTAIATPHVELYSRTRVLAITDQGEDYAVQTERGTIRARFVINATESYTAILHPQYRGKLHPVQTQAAFGQGGPASMREHIGLSGKRGFFGRHGSGVMIGSDSTQLPYHLAGKNQPSRFITKFLIGEMHRYFDPDPIEITHEWSGTPGFTADEFPIVGLIDDKRQYLIGGMCGSGTAVSFNGARHLVQKILGLDGPDDYPAAYFAPTRILDPQNHHWPKIEKR